MCDDSKSKASYMARQRVSNLELRKVAAVCITILGKREITQQLCALLLSSAPRTHAQQLGELPCSLNAWYTSTHRL
jgi:hypothetical protein